MASKDLKKDTTGLEDKPQSGKLLGLTPRTLIISIALIVLVVFWRIRDLLSMAPGIPGSALAPSALPLIVIIGLMGLSAIFKKKFQTGELIVIYSMVTAAILVAASNLYIQATCSFNFQQAYEGNPTKLGFYRDLVAPWVYPDNKVAFQGWLLGNSPVPWGEWLAPLLFLTGVVVLIFLIYLCLLTLIQRRWSTIEHLRYPLTRPILDLTNRSEGKVWPDIFYNKLFWVGLGVTVFIMVIGELRAYFPILPQFPAIHDSIDTKAWRSSFSTAEYSTAWHRSYWNITFNPGAMGIMYLISLDVLFSYWFFQLLTSLFLFFVAATGVTSVFNAFTVTENTQEFGLAIFGLMMLWVSRNEIKAFFRAAFKGENAANYESSPMPPKLAAIGVIVLPIILTWLLKAAYGAPVLWIFTWVILYAVGSLGFARLRAEAGHPTSVWVGFNGLSSLGVRFFPFAIAQRGVAFSVGLTYIEPTMAVLANHAADSYKLGEETNVRGRSMTRGLILAFTLSVVLLFVMVIKTGYNLGGSSMRYVDFKLGHWKHQVDDLTGNFQGTAGYWTRYMIGLVLGTAMVVFLYAMRLKFVWWPFHPIGLLSQVGVGRPYGVTAFAVWLIKFFCYRWGGHKVMNMLTPLFVGCIIGNSGVSTIFAIIRFLFPRLG